jgi:hypothetical protein
VTAKTKRTDFSKSTIDEFVFVERFEVKVLVLCVTVASFFTHSFLTKVMFGKKNALSRSSSFGQRPVVTRSVPSQQPTEKQLDKPIQAKMRAMSMSGIVVIDDEDSSEEVTKTELNLIRMRIDHVEKKVEASNDPHGLHFATLFADLEKLKSEATRVAIKLEENLCSLQKQRGLLEQLMASKPDEVVFGSANIKIRVGEHVFHTSLRSGMCLFVCFL